MPATLATRTERIDIRTTLAAKLELRAAAAAQQQHLSEFLLDRGLAAARQALAPAAAAPLTENSLEARVSAIELAFAGHQLLRLDRARWRAFQVALDRPVKSRPRLRRLLRKPGLLD